MIAFFLLSPSSLLISFFTFLSYSACWKAGHYYDAEETMHSMWTYEGLQPDAPMYNLMIRICADATQVERAFYYYESMQHFGFSPSLITYTSLMHACVQRERPEVSSTIACHPYYSPLHVMYSLCSIRSDSLKSSGSLSALKLINFSLHCIYPIHLLLYSYSLLYCSSIPRLLRPLLPVLPKVSTLTVTLSALFFTHVVNASIYIMPVK